MDRDPLTAIAWQFRTNQFGDLVKHVRDHTAMVGMELLALSGAKRSATLPTVWSQLPRHPNVLEPLRGDQSRFLLRYAALNWTEPPFLRVDQERLAATQLFQLASVYQMLFETTGKNVGLFRNPLVKIDLGGFIRVCFLPMKPITVRPRVTVESDVDQQHLVRLVGECARRSLSITEGSLRWDILERCLTHNKQHQYKSLEDLMAACRLAGIEYPVERTGQLSAAWLEMEQGLGWLQLPQIRDYLDRASDHFGASLELVRRDYRDAQHELVRAVASWGRGTCAVWAGRSQSTVVSDEAPAPVQPAPFEPVGSPALETLRSSAAWRKREQGFRELRKFDDGRTIIAMEWGLAAMPGWEQLRDAWLAITQQCAILDALSAERNQLLLRYAALNWKLPPLFIDTPDRVRMACGFLIDLIDAHRVLATEAADAIPWFLNPTIRIDLNLRPRIAFRATPPERHELPPEVLGRQPTWDERTLIYQVGQLMKKVVRFQDDDDTAFRQLLTACTHDRPWKRWKSFDAVIEAIGVLGFDVVELRAGRRTAGWDQMEEGLGWLELGENALAATSFREAASSAEFAETAVAGEILAKDRIDLIRHAAELRTLGVMSGAFTARLPGIERQQPPASAGTHAPSTEIRPQPSDALERARRALHLGELGHAAALLHRLRHDEELARPATLLLAEVHLRRRQFEEAHRWLEPFLAPGDDARAEYIRAKIMFASGRLHEARAAFEHVLKLAPTMLEAFLLRREVDRVLSRVRSKVGDGEQAPIAVPVALEELRDVLLSGDARRVIAALDTPKFHGDAEAQLVLARYLAMDAQQERALQAYDRVTGEHRFTALLGKASTLLELRRDESAISIFDELVAERPSDAEASEGRARALEKLGRIGEAAAEYRRFISLATAGSDLRVRAAQAWLDEHPL